MALLLLDEENGIKMGAYVPLSIMLVESGNEDILEAVDITDDQAYIGEDFAEEELAKLEEDATQQEIFAQEIEPDGYKHSSELNGGNCHTEFNTETCENEVIVDSDSCPKDNDGDAETDMEGRLDG